LTGSLLYGLRNFGGSFALMYYGLSPRAGRRWANAACVVPLFTLMLAVLWRQERLRGAAGMGTRLALAGPPKLASPRLLDSVPWCPYWSWPACGVLRRPVCWCAGSHTCTW
jgi:hypothetical protein